MIAGDAKEALRASILAIGFDEARFSDLSPLSDDRLKQWCEDGYHADMDWLRKSIEKRLDPSLVLEGACSVIMLGTNYLPEEEGVRSQERWAKYSLYEDYHDTVLKGLREAGELLEERYGIGRNDYRYYVDTGPVMERGWASASGMGWQGKNGMLISKSHGNWLFLASILVKLEVAPDAPLKRVNSTSREERGLLCGKCTRCMDACPTNAIVDEGVIDANLCISYQTIENKGIIPIELRPSIGSRIYGCDICLDICPWNRFAKSGRQLLLSKRYHVPDLGLLQILRMDTEFYRETFRKMPMKRLKLRGILRNACVVAGNLLENREWWPDGLDRDARWLSEVIDALLALAEHEEPIVRAHAIWAVGRLRPDEVSELLESKRARESDPDALVEYARLGMR